MAGAPSAIAGKHPPLDLSRRASVLIVDDEILVREVLARVLGRQPDLDIAQACDGEEAKELLSGFAFDVVVTDISMPRMDGIALMRWAQQHRPGSTWIILSGHGNFHTAVEAIRLGAYNFLAKPLPTTDAIVVAVRNALDQRRLKAEHDRLHLELSRSHARLEVQVQQLEEALELLSEQADLIRDDLKRAEVIMRALLPCDVPAVEGLSVNAVYRPSQIVGGDLYGIVRLDARKLAFFVADAVGHGVSSAMLAVLFKHRLQMREAFTAAPRAPQAVLRTLNRAFAEESTAPGLFVTAAYGLIDLESRELTVASAGHPPLVLHRADGSTEQIFHTGPALGLDARAEFTQVRIALGEGDRLLAFTDGALNSGSNGAEVGTEQLAERLAAIEVSERAALEALVDGIIEPAGQDHLTDDLTMLLVTIGGHESSIDNGTSDSLGAPIDDGSRELSVVLRGEQDDHVMYCVQGSGAWMECSAFYSSALEDLDAGRALTVDLARCTHLDSTFLGTLHEIVGRAERAECPLRIQSLLPQLASLFEELGMVRVLSHIVSEVRPLPGALAPLATKDADRAQTHSRLLYAHEALASLNEENREEFARVIDGLRGRSA